MDRAQLRLKNSLVELDNEYFLKNDDINKSVLR
ncbi:hypothetical protein Q428_12665 [Fervidicella metallireducens AeB]|uniref:Uncharacterized protein n=1 Tax=Fervidicella metallireducens AeB TaxID=1403537 RepID=A0A017RSL4_9CLOT|nr:hypothetical protein Q428_12665 [Fervidicella metallireducens AeB]